MGYTYNAGLSRFPGRCFYDGRPMRFGPMGKWDFFGIEKISFEGIWDNFILVSGSEKIDGKKNKKKGNSENKHCHDPDHLHRCYTIINFPGS